METISLSKLAAKKIMAHHSLLIAAGAGIGVDSGLPDYRGRDGLYKCYPMFQKLGVNFQSCANPLFFEEHPTNAWYFYGHRYLLYKNTQPHPGFQILKKIAFDHFHGNYFIFTTNVDGHFHKVNFEENKILECHGNINYVQCDYCKYIHKLDGFDYKLNDEKGEVEDYPKCEQCKKMLRPNILLFGDYNFLNGRVSKQEEKISKFMEESKDLAIIEIGAGSDLPLVRYFCESFLELSRNCTLIRINAYDVNIGKRKGIKYYDGENSSMTDVSFKSEGNTYIGIKRKAIDTLREIYANMLLH